VTLWEVASRYCVEARRRLGRLPPTRDGRRRWGGGHIWAARRERREEEEEEEVCVCVGGGRGLGGGVTAAAAKGTCITHLQSEWSLNALARVAASILLIQILRPKSGSEVMRALAHLLPAGVCLHDVAVESGRHCGGG